MSVAEFGAHGTGDESRCGRMPGWTAIDAENVEWDELILGISDALGRQVDRTVFEIYDLSVIDADGRHRCVSR